MKMRLCLGPVLRRLRSEERGAVIVDLMVSSVMLFWVIIASFVFFEGFRQMNKAQKAAYTIADMFSRETQPINDDYIDSAKNLQEFLTISESARSKLRVSLLTFDQNKARYEVIWSSGRNIDAHSAGPLYGYSNQLPLMPDNEFVLVVETWTEHYPRFSISLPPVVFKSFVVTRPRFSPQLVWEGADETSS